MSLAQLFYAKQALRRFRSSRLRTAKRRPAPRKFLLEPLEPRLLLDANPVLLPLTEPELNRPLESTPVVLDISAPPGPSGPADAQLPSNVVVGTIDEPGELDRYTFTLPTETLLAIDSLTSRSDLLWTLSGPTGTVGTRSFQGTDGFEANPLLRLVPGDYTFTVDGQGDATGEYRFRLLDLAAPYRPGGVADDRG